MRLPVAASVTLSSPARTVAAAPPAPSAWLAARSGDPGGPVGGGLRRLLGPGRVRQHLDENDHRYQHREHRRRPDRGARAALAAAARAPAGSSSPKQSSGRQAAAGISALPGRGRW